MWRGSGGGDGNSSVSSCDRSLKKFPPVSLLGGGTLITHTPVRKLGSPTRERAEPGSETRPRRELTAAESALVLPAAPVVDATQGMLSRPPPAAPPWSDGCGSCHSLEHCASAQNEHAKTEAAHMCDRSRLLTAAPCFSSQFTTSDLRWRILGVRIVGTSSHSSPRVRE